MSKILRCKYSKFVTKIKKMAIRLPLGYVSVKYRFHCQISIFPLLVFELTAQKKERCFHWL